MATEKKYIELPFNVPTDFTYDEHLCDDNVEYIAWFKTPASVNYRSGYFGVKQAWEEAAWMYVRWSGNANPNEFRRSNATAFYQLAGVLKPNTRYELSVLLSRDTPGLRFYLVTRRPRTAAEEAAFAEHLQQIEM